MQRCNRVFRELDRYSEASVKVVADGKQRRVRAKLRDASCDTQPRRGSPTRVKVKSIAEGMIVSGTEMAHP